MMCHRLILIGTVCVAAAVCTAGQPDDTTGAREIFEAFPHTVPIEGHAGDDAADANVELLSADRPDWFVTGRNVRDLGALTNQGIVDADNRAAQKFADIRPAPPRVGLSRSVGDQPLMVDETLESVLDGQTDKVWTFAIRSPGAFGLRLHFEKVDLGDGVMTVYSFDEAGVISRGPFRGTGPNGDGDFWTASLSGDEVFVEIRGPRRPVFEVREVLHFDRNIGFLSEDDADNSAAGGPLNCHLDIMCYGGSTHSTARDATGQMNYISGGDGYVCSGTLLNDEDGETTMPYFLTARHCLSTQSEVNTLEVVWLYQRSGCGGSLPDYDTLPRNVGGAVVNTYSENDMSFFRLGGNVPAGVTLAGWTTATSIDNAHGSHHPAGSWKRAVFLDPVGVCPGCVCQDGTDFDYYNMEGGLVEGGASGSGVFNSSGQLSGQLYGRCSDCCDPEFMTCNTVDDFWAVYGEFEETYPRIDRWLRIGGTIWADHNWPSILLQEGSEQFPFDTVTEANGIAFDGARIKITAGSYDEAVTFSRQITVLASGGVVTIGQ